MIDENYLFAYRSFELVAGGSKDGRSPDYRGEPLAVFKIDDHVDVRKEYNTVTGEKTNVRVENTEDRKWYERRFMRVDWSQNLITDFAANDAQSNGLFTAFKREPVPFFIQDGTSDYPDSYKPQFVRVDAEKDYRFADEWPKDQSDKIHYMSFVTKEVWSPGDGCLTTGGTCASASVTMRNAFLRVPPQARVRRRHDEQPRVRSLRHVPLAPGHVRARRRRRRDRAPLLHHGCAVRAERRVRHEAEHLRRRADHRPRRDRLPVVLHVAPEPVREVVHATRRAWPTGSATAGT